MVTQKILSPKNRARCIQHQRSSRRSPFFNPFIQAKLPVQVILLYKLYKGTIAVSPIIVACGYKSTVSRDGVDFGDKKD
jgi:hypothetical protein